MRNAADPRRHRILQAHGAPLALNAPGGVSGAVIVLNDITRARRLETVRREFVANVSHELRTPLTAIRGFVETLEDGSLPPEKAAHFLDVIARQVDRMNAIVEDLLLLARVEEHEGTGDTEREEVRLADVLGAAVELCEPKAAAKRIAIDVQCAADRPVRVNGALLEQAVVNLVDNAVKYSDADTTVRVEAALEGDDAVITVIDRGQGIEAPHLDRIFERFYRVDKGRSRKVGGTGLGLSIVKHVAQMHGGTVTVTSSPGAGSTFTIRLPSAAAADSEPR
jgi:two-component system phosphate regulon sensor histidine kinase PhoR